MITFFRRLIADESAASATEYAILLAVVGAAVALALGAFSGAMSTMFGTLITHMGTWVS